MKRESEPVYEILQAIRRVVRRISEHSRYLARETGLTLPQLFCLKAIEELDSEEVTVNMVSERVHLSAATVSRILDRLERAGLVIRERRSQDRRKVCLTLTASGVERYQTLPTPLQERFVERLAELSTDERARLQGALERVVELMEAEDLDASPMLAPGTDVKDA